MKLGLSFGYMHRDPSQLIQMAKGAEALGYHSIWTSEAYGYDAVTPLIWMAAHTRRVLLGTAIMQMPARTPAMTAMTAVSADFLSGGRFVLGLGVSGPQVVEGWHGVPYGKPLGRTREFVSMVRAVLQREKPLQHSGEHYEVPCSGGTGLGKPLKLIQQPQRPDLPIYLAALGPKNVALAAEIADGWLPIFFSPRRMDLFRQYLQEGAGRAGRSLDQLDIAPTVQVVLGDDLDACRFLVKRQIALYAGGMGARGKNFYNDLMCRYSYGQAAQLIQGLYLEGRKKEAVLAVPDELVDEVALCGPRERIADLLVPWKESGIGTLICAPNNPQAAQVMAELCG